MEYSKSYHNAPPPQPTKLGAALFALAIAIPAGTAMGLIAMIWD